MAQSMTNDVLARENAAPMRRSRRVAAFAAAMRSWAPLLLGAAIGFAFCVAVGYATGNPLL
jgi:hypothetical protein